jgi:hypothetical protein
MGSSVEQESTYHSITLSKYIGMALGAIPLFAGIADWVMVGTWVELWHDIHRPPSRFAPRHPIGPGIEIAIVATLACLFLHLTTYFMRRWMRRRGGFVGMGATAWRVLFAGCHLAGFVLGIWIFLASVRGS